MSLHTNIYSDNSYQDSQRCDRYQQMSVLVDLNKTNTNRESCSKIKIKGVAN